MARLFVNRLTVIDASSLHPHRGLIGESWIVDIELQGELDSQGMVLDFSEVKRQVKSLIDAEFDHRLLVPGEFAGCRIRETGELTDIEFTLNSGERIRHQGPAQSIALLPCRLVEGEPLQQVMEQRLEQLMPANVKALRLQLRRESIDGPHYCYSHGLRKHQGNCQRIAHGHRSAIRIERDGQRAPELEQDWAELWRDIYIGSRDDLVREFNLDGTRMMEFAYQAPQGRFLLQLPGDRCHIIDSESTVENLARHIAEALKAKHPGSRFRVHAFEGVDKGAICER